MSELLDLLLDGEYIEAITRVYTDLIGEPLVALIVFGATGAAFYITQRRMIIPLVMLFLIGGITLASIPAPASSLIIIFVALGVMTIIYLLYQQALGSFRFRG